MKRGNLVTIATQGDFGKPRPALVIQADEFTEHTSITVLLLTSTSEEAPLFRIPIAPNAANNLQKPSHIMVDRATTQRYDKIGPAFGHVDDKTMMEVTRALAVFLGLAG